MRHLDRYPKILEEDGVSACAAGEAPKAGAKLVARIVRSIDRCYRTTQHL